MSFLFNKTRKEEAGNSDMKPKHNYAGLTQRDLTLKINICFAYNFICPSKHRPKGMNFKKRQTQL